MVHPYRGIVLVVSQTLCFSNVFVLIVSHTLCFSNVLFPYLSLVAHLVGQVLPSNQSNNLYVFPGLALGAKLCQAKLVRNVFFGKNPGDRSLVKRFGGSDIIRKK